MLQSWYKIILYSGSLTDQKVLNLYPHKVKRQLKNPNWGNVVEVYVNQDQLKDIQKAMVKHYTGPEPWYASGQNLNADEAICAFGADDGENGKVFIFHFDDMDAYRRVLKYGESKGIPRKVMDFLGKDV
ncbi:hypothetical protein A3B02_02325 [Candidatus Roizmanbacteria bacterium RIFCSPLOWO2_01_FULL_42_14]|uniref:Uncharacterized protein n=2 Tax=Candidatus Roizmaniibacteriota TaxID=1752723 RepID=A0A1F7J8P3_9BACT|nr:MAG: hypothetical protein A3D08_01240 [Candidatus Roizmanbacteria bacterium RIFCSPHIGHO2_02_FULL_43_11]OGK51958.1 MAG: hypothetical protein A3B02_02325 [Candidatus Roizmanbacteria bacterium RIFCSPLOWO2_01_FULL_42_14]